MIDNTGNRQKRFLNNFWAARYKKVADKKVFKEFTKEIIKKAVNVEHFMKDLFEDSRIFRMINAPSKEDWKEQKEIQLYYSINAISRVFGVEVANSILITLIRDYKNKLISRAYLTKAIQKIEQFHFINNAISSNRSSGLDKMYSKLSRDLNEAKTKSEKHRMINDMVIKLQEKIPSLENFASRFDEKLCFTQKNAKQKSLVQYALRKLEFKQNANADLLDISIEHIYPENPKDFPKLSEAVVGNIGNLCILDAGLNSDARIGNSKYEIKKPVILAESHIGTTKRVFEANQSWGEKQIKKRRDKLIQELYTSVW